MNNPWSAIVKPSSEFNVRLVAEDHPLRLYWGVDSRGQYLFLVDAPKIGLPDKRHLPHLVGIRTVVATDGDRGKLVLLLKEKVNWELFHALCSDLARSTSAVPNESSGGAIILRRLHRWEEFLRRDRRDVLSIEQIKGLIGELLFLKDRLATLYGWEQAITSWKGPEEAPQDFAIYDTAVEVKCQAGASRPTVRINSVEQLNPQLPKGFLIIYTLATAEALEPETFTLNGIVTSIRKTLMATQSSTARERFEDLLFLAGYTMSDRYDEDVFQVTDMQCFRLTDGFPRLKPTTIPQGVTKVTYHLSLGACTPFACNLDLETP